MAKQYGCFEKWEKKGLVTGLTAMLALAVSLPAFGRFLQVGAARPCGPVRLSDIAGVLLFGKKRDNFLPEGKSLVLTT